mmetsp:Transcript_58072/g.155175  ORF Transcript_58072/g.155175 Transcript_58072/m.155175 type:complete len:257 (-) Transcript_58072:1831-2601(-)
MHPCTSCTRAPLQAGLLRHARENTPSHTTTARVTSSDAAATAAPVAPLGKEEHDTGSSQKMLTSKSKPDLRPASMGSYPGSPQGVGLHGACRTSSCPRQVFPLNVGCCRISRACVRTPPPQVTEHDDASAQVDSTQSAPLQGNSLHPTSRSVSRGHAFPPNFGSTCTSRRSTRVPPLQAREQFPARCQEVIRQSTGQGKRLQRTVRSRSSGQGAPPLLSRRLMDRAWIRVPPPQELLHTVVLVQLVTAQSSPLMKR